MRRTLIATLAVLALAAALCVAGQRTVFRLTDEALRRQAAVEAAFDAGGGALSRAEELGLWWRDRHALLQLLTHHDLLDRVEEALETARLSLSAGDGDGFAQACAQFRRLIGHMREMEEVSFSNLC